jgi:hypothetical protein
MEAITHATIASLRSAMKSQSFPMCMVDGISQSLLGTEATSCTRREQWDNRKGYVLQAEYFVGICTSLKT